MKPIKKQYIVDKANQRVAVVIDYETFELIEDMLEDYAMLRLFQTASGEDALDLETLVAFYSALPEAEC